MSDSNSQFWVDVLMITYQHEKFIAQAIEGVIMQKTNFKFRFLIFDDCSPDSTQNVVEGLLDHSNSNLSIIYKRNIQNLGITSNGIQSLNEAKSKYIAICEGDDYWTDPFKLQKQVDFLEANPDFAMCYHPVNHLYTDGRIERDLPFEALMKKSNSTIYDLAAIGNYISTPSVVFRNVLDRLPDSFSKSPIGDYFLWILLAQTGEIKKLDEVMAVYRVGVGVFSTKEFKRQDELLSETLNLLVSEVEEDSIKEILKNKIIAIKLRVLPFSFRNLERFDLIFSSDFISRNFDYRLLLKALLLKVLHFVVRIK